MIAGAGIELAESLLDLDMVLCSIRAGSVGAGYSVSVGAVTDAKVIGVQAAAADAVYHAWQSGDLTSQESADTFAEGIGARVPFAIPVEIMRDHLDAMDTVSESAIIEAVAVLFEEERILVEGACAPPMSVVEEFGTELAGETVAIPITGRNLPSPEVTQVLQ